MLYISFLIDTKETDWSASCLWMQGWYYDAKKIYFSRSGLDQMRALLALETSKIWDEDQSTSEVFLSYSSAVFTEWAYTSDSCKVPILVFLSAGFCVFGNILCWRFFHVPYNKYHKHLKHHQAHKKKKQHKKNNKKWYLLHGNLSIDLSFVRDIRGSLNFLCLNPLGLLCFPFLSCEPM